MSGDATVTIAHQEVGNGQGRVEDGSIVGVLSSQQADSHTQNHTGQEGMSQSMLTAAHHTCIMKYPESS